MDVLDIRAIGKGFFDSKAVLKRLNKGERKILSKYGAWVRTAASRSIRKRKRASKPGQPPSSHEGSLRRFILFAYDAPRHAVVVGPVGFDRKPGAMTVPALLEKGGRSTKTLVRLSGGRLVSPKSPLLKGAGPGGREVVTQAAKYAKRPFMGPAAATVRRQLKAELRKFLG